MAINRRTGVISATTVLLGLLWLSPGVSAGPIEQMRFTTDFSFVVNGKQMPAGTYVVRRIGTDPKLLEITNRVKKGVLVSVQNVKHRPETYASDAGVMFEGSGGRYVLKTMWDDATGAVESITAAEEIADATERRPLDTLVVPAIVER